MSARLALVLALGGAAVGCGDAISEPVPDTLGGSTLWGRRFGKSTSTDPVVVATDKDGNAVVGGRFFATADFGSGPVTSPANNWQAFVAKYDGGGELLWMRSFGGIFEEEVTAVAFDGDGNVYAAGSFRGTIDFGGGPHESASAQPDVFIAKLAPDGSHLWSKRFGASGYHALYGMAVNEHGDVALAGYADGAVDFGTGPIMLVGQEFVAKLDPSGATAYVTDTDTVGLPPATYPTVFGIDGEGAFVAAADRYTDQGDQRLLLFKLDPAGGTAWQREIASSTGIAMKALSLGADGTILLTGSVGEYTEFGSITSTGLYGEAFAAATEPDGTLRWVHRFTRQDGPGDPGFNFTSVLSTNAIAAAGSDVVVTGSFFGIADFGGTLRQSIGLHGYESSCCSYDDDVFAVRLDASGAHLWDRTFGNMGLQAGTSISADPAGDVFVAGWANGALPFADSAFAGTDYNDGFLVKLAR